MEKISKQLLQNINLTNASRLLSSQKLTSSEIIDHCYNLACEGEEKLKLNAYTYINDLDDLLERARASDERIRSNKRLSPLDGLPISVKANISCKGLPLHACSRILGGGGDHTDDTEGSDSVLLSAYDSDVVHNLVHKSGAILLGQTNMDEFGMGSFGFHSANGPTRNPLYLENDDYFSAGGSSAGAAAAICHGSSLASIGTDTGGSVRLPAAWCGVVGYKPTYGSISRYGVVAYASSLDTVGILARTVPCTALVMDCASGQSDRDATTIIQRHNGQYFQSAWFDADTKGDEASLLEENRILDGLRIGIPSAFSVDECPQSIHEAWETTATKLRKMGAEVVNISNEIIRPETVKNSLAAYYVIACAEASSNLMRYDGLRYGPTVSISCEDSEKEVKEPSQSPLTPLEQQYCTTRSSTFGAEVQRRVVCGTAVLSSDYRHAYYEAASKLRVEMMKEFDNAFSQVDLILVPTAVSPPPRLGTAQDNTEMLGNDVMTVPASLACLPTISIPIEKNSSNVVDGQPSGVTGMQLLGAKSSDKMVLSIAALVERKL